MTTARPNAVFAAVHMGPYQALAPLEACLRGPVTWAVDGLARQHRVDRREPFVDAAMIAAKGEADAFLGELSPSVVVLGTSDDVDGTNLEEMLAAAARRCDIPVVVVEDFPGNFHTASDARVDALCVETDDVAELHAERGMDLARIHVTGNPRYDALRDVDRGGLRQRTRARLGLGDGAVVLWVGQPNDDDSYATLGEIVPWLGGACLLFRAHPRDAGYARGRYASLFGMGGLTVIDVTRVPDVPGLCCAADLVVTQFSSVAVEGAYLGTPALFVLLPDYGGAYIRKRKGYAIPPWCKENCAFLLDDAKMTAVVVDGAMHDSEAREAVRVNFARRYTTRPPAASTVARIITAFAER